MIRSVVTLKSPCLLAPGGSRFLSLSALNHSGFRRNLRENIPNPKPHRSKFRRITEKALEPIPPPRPPTMAERCSRRQEIHVEYVEEKAKPFPIELAMKKHIKELLSEKPCVAICQLLPMERYVFQRARGLFAEAGYDIHRWNNRVMNFVIDDVPLWENLRPLFVAQNMYVLHKDLDIRKLTGLLAKAPRLVLMALATPERILHATEVNALAAMPSLDMLPVETVGILSAPALETSMYLDRIPQELSRLLDSRSKDDK